MNQLIKVLSAVLFIGLASAFPPFGNGGGPKCRDGPPRGGGNGNGGNGRRGPPRGGPPKCICDFIGQDSNTLKEILDCAHQQSGVPKPDFSQGRPSPPSTADAQALANAAQTCAGDMGLDDNAADIASCFEGGPPQGMPDFMQQFENGNFGNFGQGQG